MSNDTKALLVFAFIVVMSTLISFQLSSCIDLLKEIVENTRGLKP